MPLAQPALVAGRALSPRPHQGIWSTGLVAVVFVFDVADASEFTAGDGGVAINDGLFPSPLPDVVADTHQPVAAMEPRLAVAVNVAVALALPKQRVGHNRAAGGAGI